MFFRRMKTPGIAHVAYLIGDRGEAAVVDPRRDVDEYLTAAREQGLTIRFVIETHRQEDFVLGSAELARLTGARIVNGRHSLFGHGDIRLADGEELSLATFRLRALHTPGHTPESMCYAVFVPASPDHAWAAFTGDTLFVGETGRTDLPDPRRTAENAGLLYDGVHRKLLPLGDQTILLPAHGSGSVCGGNIAERDDSTIGLERRYNPVFVKTREDFMRAKVEERIPRPPYFSLMERMNAKGGVPLAQPPGAVPVLQPERFASEMGQGVVLDAREPEAFAASHVPGSYSVWAGGLPVFGGWIAGEATPVFLVVPSADAVESAILSLARIGVDRVEGVLGGGFEAWRNAGRPIAAAGAIAPRELAARRADYRVLDVREDTEFEDEGHIPSAAHLYVGYLERHLGAIEPPLERSAPIAVTCSVGHRASLAASILRRHGFAYVSNLLGGMTAWGKLGLPTERGGEASITTPQIEGARS